MPKDEAAYAPTIDIGEYLKDPKSHAAAKTIEDVRKACISTGFFQITGHGVSKALQERVFNAARAFFALPFEEKKGLDASKNVGRRGYDVFASQSYEDGVSPDLKEGYFIGKDISTSDPLHGRFFMGPNVWPLTSSLPNSAFREPCEEYYEELQKLSCKVLELIGHTMTRIAPGSHSGNVDSDADRKRLDCNHQIPSVLHDIMKLDSSPVCPFRLLHYPSALRSKGDGDEATTKPQYGASAHTDFGAITLLLQDENPGLEVLETKNGMNIWRPIDPNPDAYVVNIGDIVSMVTNGEYKSSMHRVVCKRPENERYSIVFFLDGCLDVVLTPVEGFEASKGLDKLNAGPYKTVEQHMVERLTMSYGSDGKDPRRHGKTLDN